MQNKNICKFVTPSIENRLSVKCFILETDKAVAESPHKLSCNRLTLATAGEGAFKIGEESIPFSAGSLFFAFEGETVYATVKNSFEYMYIDFSGVRAEELFRRFGINPKNRSFKNFDGLAPLWRESLSRANEQNVDLAAESMLLYTLSRFSADSVEKSSIVTKMIEISEERFNDSALSLNALAEELGYNSKYISHSFKDKMGIGYAEYLRNLRIKYAVSLFDHGIDSVKNVAILSGFSDPLYFSTVFKNTVGLSPKEYLKKQ
jgi:AraC-like DNA-binding protein